MGRDTHVVVRSRSRTFRGELEFQTGNRIPLVIVRYRYKGNGLDVPPPTVCECLDALALVERTFPIDGIDVLSVREMDMTTVFTGLTKEEESDAWLDELNRLDAIRTQDDNARSIFMGLLPAATPVNRTLGMPGSGWPVIAKIPNSYIAPHELGHSLGFQKWNSPALSRRFWSRWQFHRALAQAGSVALSWVQELLIHIST